MRRTCKALRDRLLYRHVVVTLVPVRLRGYYDNQVAVKNVPRTITVTDQATGFQILPCGRTKTPWSRPTGPLRAWRAPAIST